MLKTALLVGGLVDRIHLFVAPQIMGSMQSRLQRHGPRHPHGRIEVEPLRQRPRLCSLLRDPWPQDE